MRFASCALLCVTALAACSGNSTQTVAPRTDLFGSWRVDPTVADSLRHDGSEERAGGHMRPGGRGTYGGGMAGRRGSGGRGRIGPSASLGDADQMRAVIETFRREGQTLRLAQTNDGVSVRYDERDIDFPIGRSVKNDIGSLHDVKSKARWVDGHLEIEHKIRGVKIVESFERGVDSPRLVVTTRIENAFRPMEFQRVYIAD